MFNPKEWKVEIESFEAISPPNCAFTRSFISAAALLVKVTAQIEAGSNMCCLIKLTILVVITLVFPDPAPARTRQGPEM